METRDGNQKRLPKQLSGWHKWLSQLKTRQQLIRGTNMRTVLFRSNQLKMNGLFSGPGRIRGRGNSTWLWYPKKPYRIQLDSKAELLGLKADKDWVLPADYRDPTHLRNTFAFTLGQALELPYTNHSRYVEVTFNNDYIGFYMLTEQVEQGENRVNYLSTVINSYPAGTN